MKKTFAFILFALLTTTVALGNYQEVVYLKNGDIIRGVIIEQIPGQTIKIETPEHSVLVFPMDEIDQLAREKTENTGDQPANLTGSAIEDKDHAGTRFGVKGGLNLSNIYAKDNDKKYSDNYSLKPGFHIGVTAEMPITASIAFETGLFVSTKGFKSHQSDGSDEYNSTINLIYLELPLMAKKYFTVGETQFFGTFGPYVGYGLSGKSKYKRTTNGETRSTEHVIKWGADSNDDIKHLDFGLTAGAGIQLNAVQIGLSYHLGLANMDAGKENGMIANNRVIALSLGYQFGGK